MERWEKALKNFIYHFGYKPNDPNSLSEMKDKYPDVLERSVRDNQDYTIEMYGTDPQKQLYYDPNALIID